MKPLAIFEYLFLITLLFSLLASQIEANNVSSKCEQDWRDLELFLPVGLKSPNRINEWRDMFLYSYVYFWPIKVANTKLMLVVDEEERQNPYIATMESELQSHQLLRSRSRIVYNQVPGNIYDNSGWKRQQYIMMYADNYTTSEYVGFVDTDCMFVTYIHSSDLFEKGKPVINGKTGNPYKNGEKEEPVWKEIIQTTYDIMGIKEPMKCMSYWPVIIKTAHIKLFRKFLEKKYQLPFYQIMEQFIAKKWFGQFNMFCAYLFEFHNDEYVWYMHNISPGWQYDGAFEGMSTNHSIYTSAMEYPKPRIAIHGRYHSPVIYAGGAEFYEIMKVGSCFSPPYPKPESSLLAKYCNPYYNTLDHFQQRVNVEMYKFERFSFYKSYEWSKLQQAMRDRYQRLEHCDHLFNQTMVQQVFQTPIVVPMDIVYFTEFTGAALFVVKEDYLFHSFSGWGAFVANGFTEKPRQKITAGLYHLIPFGDKIG